MANRFSNFLLLSRDIRMREEQSNIGNELLSSSAEEKHFEGYFKERNSEIHIAVGWWKTVVE